MGKRTFLFKNKPIIVSASSVVGKKEGEGPLAEWFDHISKDDTFGEDTWEKSESMMLKIAIEDAIRKSGKQKQDIDVMLSGDLLNQLMSSSFMARDIQIPFLGVYGACSTMTESLLLGAALVDGGYCKYAVNAASSHFCSAERQFRMPLEHGNQTPRYAQNTVVGAGAMVLSNKKRGNMNIRVTSATVGRVIDTGITDANQMGAAMAPAAVDSILTHFYETGRRVEDYDLIITGDLGFVGKEIAKNLLRNAGIDELELDQKFKDCGAMIYEKTDDEQGGGSGCGCSASVYAGYLYKEMKKGAIERVLILSTGALLSTISPFQGESIPGIAHAVSLEVEQEV